jgi:arylformamidase
MIRIPRIAFIWFNFDYSKIGIQFVRSLPGAKNYCQKQRLKVHLKQKKMDVIDLTHPLQTGMPVFPGEPGPSLSNTAVLQEQGYRVKWLEMGSHTGTHMDAPAHLIPEGKTLDSFPVSHFSGVAYIMVIPEGTREISIGFVRQFADSLGNAEYLLLNTGWSRYWGQESYFRGFPVLSAEAAVWLSGYPLRGIGMDTISADPVESVTLPIHHILLQAGMVLVENLTFPDHGCPDHLFFCCFPLKITGADGSPLRAVAFTGQSDFLKACMATDSCL